jgi:hypothetical protein
VKYKTQGKLGMHGRTAPEWFHEGEVVLSVQVLPKDRLLICEVGGKGFHAEMVYPQDAAFSHNNVDFSIEEWICEMENDFSLIS